MGARQQERIEIKVGIGEWKVTHNPALLIAIGLGSCVGVAIYDRVAGVGGLAHVMLPDSRGFAVGHSLGKFADLAVPALWRALERDGCKRYRARSKLAGGARMFSFSDSRIATLNIGERNVEAVKACLADLGLVPDGEDTGGNTGRTMILDTVTGTVLIRTGGRAVKEI